MSSNLHDLFDTFMTKLDLYPKPVPNYPNTYVDIFGYVYNERGEKITPYHYNDNKHYDAIHVRDVNGKSHVIGVHQAVAMTFNPKYYPGCLVHHHDENKYNNRLSNLKISSRSQHAAHHNPQKYTQVMVRCQVCGNMFMWSPASQQLYYSDLRRGKNRIISCSKACSSYYGRMIQLGRSPGVAE